MKLDYAGYLARGNFVVLDFPRLGNLVSVIIKLKLMVLEFLPAPIDTPSLEQHNSLPEMVDDRGRTLSEDSLQIR